MRRPPSSLRYCFDRSTTLCGRAGGWVDLRDNLSHLVPFWLVGRWRLSSVCARNASCVRSCTRWAARSYGCRVDTFTTRYVAKEPPPSPPRLCFDVQNPTTRLLVVNASYPEKREDYQVDRCERPSWHLNAWGVLAGGSAERPVLPATGRALVLVSVDGRGGGGYVLKSPKGKCLAVVCVALIPAISFRRRRERPALADNSLSSAAFYCMYRRCEKVCCHCLK